MIKDTIIERRSIKKANDAPISRETINTLLEQAAFAPFHSKVEPWNVYVLHTLEEKERYIEKIIAFNEREQEVTFSEAEIAELKAGYAKKIITPPYLLIVTTNIIGHGKKDFESIGATSAFIQNIQLLGWEAGIGMIWRTNRFIFDDKFATDLGIPNEQKIIGTLHLTTLAEIPEPKPRRPLNEWVKDLADL
ncbi:nitroreductase [Listeria seeligeri]|uniref:nitroreductase family protein n=1 Tax=Listeria seeligeri TaxID=1640 RepID=UPI00162AC054|nr:nitroreductase family protein [Listeria seeligeri]MBC1826280.1 nitroreductase [Listeria seeligeri]MBC1865451.1 nitroreductase [Listeria seeligeri]MBC6130816.1 nitroreductase [Listeria seeligeri]MBF2524664.1 nitroreductase family protein [Listeria seeligeri]MBF2551833.1 nitroreductase family protein [Listeria seeligeri]